MTKKILAVDDERLILITISRALTKIGYTVVTALNMDELAAALLQAPYDLLITDVHMEGDTVENIIERVQRTSPSLKVIRISGSAESRGEGNFIEKPFRIDELREKVGKVLDEPS